MRPVQLTKPVRPGGRATLIGLCAHRHLSLEPSVAGLFANASREATEVALRSALPGPKLPTRRSANSTSTPTVALTGRISTQFLRVHTTAAADCQTLCLGANFDAHYSVSACFPLLCRRFRVTTFEPRRRHGLNADAQVERHPARNAGVMSSSPRHPTSAIST